MIESLLLEELERFSDALHTPGLSPPYPPFAKAELYPHLIIDRSTHSNSPCSYFS